MSGSTPSEARQRWRLTFSRAADAPALAMREQLAAWEGSLAVSGLPIVGLEAAPPRPRLVLGAPLPVGMATDADLLDLFLTERRPVADVRVRLAGSLPAGHALVDLHDVWLGEASLAGLVVAADYLVTLGDGALDRDALARAADAVLAAATLPRTRSKGEREVPYDLRPLVAAIEVGPAAPDRPLALRLRTRMHPERGTGRPEEVIAALAEAAGCALPIASLARERLWLSGDMPGERGAVPA